MRWGQRLALLTTAAGVPVAVTYLAQPLLTLLAAEFGATEAELGWAASAMPLGYAVGIVTLLPLSDRIQPRTLAQVQASATAVFLALAAAAPSLLVLCLSLGIAGAGATFAQVLVPVAVRLAPPRSVGTSTGLLAGSFLTAIFAMRVGAAWIGEVAGWRTVFVVAAVVVAAVIPLIRIGTPLTELHPGRSYRSILRGLPRLAAQNRAVVVSMIAQGCIFFSFQALWTTVVLHFTAAPFGWSVADVGLVGLAGLGAGLLTLATGRLVDVWGSVAVAALCACAGLVAAIAIASVPTSAAIVVIGMFLISVGMQTSQTATQTHALRSVPPQQTGSGNTLFMTGAFVGGSLGSGGAVWVFSVGGFALVALVTVVPLAVSLVVLIAARAARQPLSTD